MTAGHVIIAIPLEVSGETFDTTDDDRAWLSSHRCPAIRLHIAGMEWPGRRIGP
jgi:hypothetical protein